MPFCLFLSFPFRTAGTRPEPYPSVLFAFEAQRAGTLRELRVESGELSGSVSGKGHSTINQDPSTPPRPNGPGHGSPGQSEERATPWVPIRPDQSPERARQRLSRTDSADAKPTVVPGLRSP